MKHFPFLVLLMFLYSCASVENFMYPGGRGAAKGSTVIQASEKNPQEDPDSPVEVSSFVASEETFSCQNLGYISDYSISASNAKNGLIAKSEQLGGNRVYLTGTNAISGTAQGYALKCHPMTGVPLEVVHARCEKKSNPSACEYYWQWLMSLREYAEAAKLSCTECEYDMNEMCGRCETSKQWVEGEKIKKRLISECNKGNAKSCHKCAIGHYQEGDRDGSLSFAQIGCANGSNQACQFQQSLMLEKQAIMQNETLNQQQMLQLYQLQQSRTSESFRDLANTVDGMSERQKPIQFNQGVCEYRFFKDLSRNGGRWIESCR